MRDHQGLPFEIIGDPQFLDNGTGRCKSTFSTPATHLANGTFVVVWFEQGKDQKEGNIVSGTQEEVDSSEWFAGPRPNIWT